MKKIITFILALAVMISTVPQNAGTVYAATRDIPHVIARSGAALSDTKVKMKVGETRQLNCIGGKGTLKWKSNNKSIATVDSKGLVKAKNPGKATITVKGTKIGTLKCVVYVKITQKQAQKRILALKKKYPEGLYWTNENNSYYWEANNTYCFGCIAFAGEVSDKVFGKTAKITTHKNFDKIKVGDHIRIGNYHSVIVLSKAGDHITVVEGNYNSSIHWGREITRADLQEEGFYVDTRY